MVYTFALFVFSSNFLYVSFLYFCLLRRSKFDEHWHEDAFEIKCSYSNRFQAFSLHLYFQFRKNSLKAFVCVWHNSEHNIFELIPSINTLHVILCALLFISLFCLHDDDDDRNNGMKRKKKNGNNNDNNNSNHF